MASYAILMAISWYPGLTDLQGPEHDVDDFNDWLQDQSGGNLAPENIIVIKSSNFPKVTDPYSAQPAEAAFRKALNGLLFEDGIFKNKVGERLYLFFAGHGFAGRRLAEAVLYSAQTLKNDPEHIACKRYAERIVNSNAFDEVILIMDCCRDVDLTDMIQDPTIKIPDRQGLAAEVRFMEAYAVGRGQQAREREITPGGKVRGLFSWVLCESLRNATADSNGNVTGHRLKEEIFKRWKKLFNGVPGYSPEIMPPAGEKDIVFVRRPVPELIIKFNTPLPQPDSFIVVFKDDLKEVARVPYEPSGTRISLADGWYKIGLDGSPRSGVVDFPRQIELII